MPAIYWVKKAIAAYADMRAEKGEETVDFKIHEHKEHPSSVRHTSKEGREGVEKMVERYGLEYEGDLLQCNFEGTVDASEFSDMLKEMDKKIDLFFSSFTVEFDRLRVEVRARVPETDYKVEGRDKEEMEKLIETFRKIREKKIREDPVNQMWREAAERSGEELEKLGEEVGRKMEEIDEYEELEDLKDLWED
ncbi:MAG: hypothetical protein ABEK01_01575, partial [Candidatus Nanohaloarchaea archaeon]